MRKLLSLTVMSALSVMLAWGVTLAAGGDQAFGQGTVTVVDDITVEVPNDVWIVAEINGQQVGDWSKDSAFLGDPTVTPSKSFTQVLKVKNMKEVQCSAQFCEDLAYPKYKLVTTSYNGDNSEFDNSVRVTVTDKKLSRDNVLYSGPLSELESQPFEVGYSYVFPDGTRNTIITELEIKYTFSKTAKESYIDYQVKVQELPTETLIPIVPGI